MTNTRYEYLDIAKGLGILAVVWAHIMLSGWSHKICYAFYMPLFFMISGMLFQRDKYATFWDFLIRRGKRLFVPYILYSVVTWVIWVAFRICRGDAVDSWWMPLLQTFIAQGSGAYLVHNSALWFIPCLFAVEMIFFFICKMRMGGVMISFVMAGLSFLMGRLFGDTWWNLLPWNLDAALIALPFYAVGNVFVGRMSHDKVISYVKSHKMGAFCIWITLTFLLIMGTMKYGTCSMGSSLYNCSGWVFVLRAFVGCFALLFFSLLLNMLDKKHIVFQKLLWYFKWMGKNSLDVMCTHIPVKGVFIIIVATLLHVGQETVSSTMSLSFVVFVATLLVVTLAVIFVNYFFRNKISKCRK